VVVMIMYVKTAKVAFRLVQAGSLKDKRQVARGLADRLRNKFNVSVAEVSRQDVHKELVLGLSLVSANEGHGQNCLDEILRFMEDFVEMNGAGELVEVEIW
jgi:uncharacterized protein YlxP (DUF503 family)